MFGYHRRNISKNSAKVSRRRRNNVSRSFEPLEDRRLLTTFHVTTTADPVIPLAGKLSLREAIDLANAHPGADVIVLKAGPNDAYKITIAGGSDDDNLSGDFDITDDLTIKSAGSGFPTIGGNGLDRVLDIPSGNDGISLTLNHVIVTGGIASGTSGFGGGVRADGLNDKLIFIDATVKNNVSTSPGGGAGGGVFNDEGDITLINSHVDNNSAAAGVFGRGGGIYMDDGSGILKIINSTVNNNSAYSGGGGIYVVAANTLTVTNSQVNNNHSGDEGGGGAFFEADSIAISGSSFSGNTTSGQGGAILSDSDTQLTISKSYFCSNSAASDGGAIWADEAPISISGSTFKDNTSTGGVGGALSNVTEVHVTDSTFNHNVALGVGGAIDQEDEADVTILRSTFTQNASLGDTGGAINGNGGTQTIAITDSKFTFNSALEQGGAIAADGETVKILRSTFDHNTSVNDDGGAIDDGIIDATDSKFTYNTSKADGGAINSEDNNITLLRCLFSCNTATNGEGGGFSDGGPDSTETVTDCTIDGNTAGGNGGGFAAEGVTLTMTRSTVSNNRSGSEGGGIFVITSGIQGDLYPSSVLPGSLITNCTISGNGSASSGGGIDFEGDGDLTIINCTIVFNASFNGGGIAQTVGGGLIHIGNTIVAKNIATNDPDAYNPATVTFDDLGHNLVFADPDTVFTDSSDIFNEDPLLGPLANNGGLTKTHALLKHSPAINAGDDALNPGTDQRGVKRPQGSHVDIGAYEKK